MALSFEHLLTEDQRDALQEIANVGMGLAGARLAALLGEFVELSIPSITPVAVQDLPGSLGRLVADQESVTVVRQAFTCDVRGEALVLLEDHSIPELWQLMGYDEMSGSLDMATEHEILIDLSNLITGACLSCMFEQLGRSLTFSPPTIMGRRTRLSEMLRPESMAWDVSLLVEVKFSIENHTFCAHLVMLTVEDSLRTLKLALDDLLECM
jgi:chemotaxis protein CheC